MFTKRTFFLSLLLLTLLVPAFIWTLNHFSKKTSAQVTSGSTFIGDINIDSGGGRRDSGSVAIVNSSIGDTFGGVFVSGSTLVGAGHAFKDDLTANIVIDKLVVTPGQTGIDDGRIGLSGKLSTEGGRSHFNDILVNPRLTATSNGVQLVGAAFTENRNDLTTFADLTASANASNGFVIVYANQGVTKQYRVGATNFNQTFAAGNFYVFYKGLWSGALQPGDITGLSSQGIVFEVASSALNTSKATSPKVYVTFYQNTSTSTWQTYVLGTGFGVADQIVQKDPVLN